MAYALFAGEHYYPAGGMDDCRGVFESVEAAQQRFTQGHSPEDDYSSDFDWGHIVDTTTFTVVLDWGVVVEGKRATKTRPAQLEQWDWVAPRSR